MSFLRTLSGRSSLWGVGGLEVSPQTLQNRSSDIIGTENERVSIVRDL